MAVRLPIYKRISVDGYQMYPGTIETPGISHSFTPGLHLIAGVNGLGKSTLLLILYHGLVGPASVKGDDFGVAMPDVALTRDADRFRKRVADGGRESQATVNFTIGNDEISVTRSLHDLSIKFWSINGTEQVANNAAYNDEIARMMNVGSFADVLIIMNLIVFMFESRGLLMWNEQYQRNALRTLFMSPSEANQLAARAQVVAKTNSAYRNLLYIVGRDKKLLARDKAALAAADAVGAEYSMILKGISGLNERLEELRTSQAQLQAERLDAANTLETAKFNYDDTLREIEALKLAKIAAAFPTSEKSSHLVLARLIGDHKCLACGADDGPLIERWIETIQNGNCLVCGSLPEAHEALVPATALEAARLKKAEERLQKSEQAHVEALAIMETSSEAATTIQLQIDEILRQKGPLEKRAQQILGTSPPDVLATSALENRISNQEETLSQLWRDQQVAELEFSKVFAGFQQSIGQKADQIRERFGARISEFLVEKAEITLATSRGPVGESGQSYDWPVFRLSMTSGAYEAPALRRNREDVSMSQGEFIDLAFRLALVEVAANDAAATMVFDAPEASLDALFMRRAGAFLAKFTDDNDENRLIVTSNLTNADMIPALFGAYDPKEGDPEPKTIPRDQRRDRVIDLLSIAAPTRAVELVGDRYRDLLDQALFPPHGEAKSGL